MKKFRVLLLWGIVCVSAGLFLAGCAGMSPKSESYKAACLNDTKIDTSVSKDAALTELSCEYKIFEGAEVVHLKVGVQNLGNEPKRFKVHLFLDDGKAVGGLIPRKTKKGLVKPGEVASFVYPVNGMTRHPKEITVHIRSVSP